MSSKSWTDLGMEQIEGGVHQVKQQAQQAPKNIAKSVIAQITGKSNKGDVGSNESANASVATLPSHVNSSTGEEASDKVNEDVVKELYAPSEKPIDQTDSQKSASEFIQKKIESGMSVEEAQKLYSLRKQLHSEYYQKLISYKNQQPEERTAEKVEKEKEEDDRMNLEEQKKKDAPIAVQMGSNKTEQFPGASG